MMKRHAKFNLCHLLEMAAESFPSGAAVTYRDEAVRYGELWRRACAFATGLAQMGLSPRERVAIFIEKRIETVVSIFGAAAANGAFVPVNPLLKPDQVSYILKDCAVRVLVTSPERLAQLGAQVAVCEELEHIVVAGRLPDELRTTIDGRIGLHEWDELLAAPGSWIAPRNVDSDMAAILYTSGSTGKPKGVVLSHRNLIVGAESVSQYLENTHEDVILSVLPLSFDAGLSQLTTAFNVGAHVVLLNYLLPRDVVRMCERHGVTGITGVPPFWIQVASLDWPPAAAARMRYFANTGGRMPKATLDKLRAQLPAALPYLMYGLTEAFRSTYLPPEEAHRRPDSIGKAIPNAEILVVRPDGTRCAPGEEGELVHRGPLVAMGYWNDPERTAERFRASPGAVSGVPADHAVFSGDTVVTDEDGFLYFIGRRDDMIKTSGYRVSPTEIEEAAYATGLVRDAVALGIDDQELGQRVVLVASPYTGEELDDEQLRQAMRQVLPQYMVPSRILVMETIPTSPNGKFDRVLLRSGIANR